MDSLMNTAPYLIVPTHFRSFIPLSFNFLCPCEKPARALTQKLHIWQGLRKVGRSIAKDAHFFTSFVKKSM